MAALLARAHKVGANRVASAPKVQPQQFVRYRRLASVLNRGHKVKRTPGDVFPEEPVIDTEEIYEDENGNWIPRGRPDPTYPKRSDNPWLSDHLRTAFNDGQLEWFTRRGLDPRPRRQAPKARYSIPPRGDMTVEKFLNTIGRGAPDHVDKFESWEQLMTCNRLMLKQKDIPIKDRKFIMHWVEKYKQGNEPQRVMWTSKAKKNKQLQWVERNNERDENGDFVGAEKLLPKVHHKW